MQHAESASAADLVGVSRKASLSSVPASRLAPRGLREGHLLFRDTPLSVDVLFAKRDAFHGALRALFPKRAPWAWVDMTLQLLTLATFYKSCFPSASWVGARALSRRGALEDLQTGPASRKSFFNMVAWLEGHGMIVRHATQRVGGRQSSNDYDLRALMRWLARWLREWGARRRGKRVEQVGAMLWEKVGGFWEKVGGARLADTGPPMSAAAAPG